MSLKLNSLVLEGLDEELTASVGLYDILSLDIDACKLGYDPGADGSQGSCHLRQRRGRSRRRTSRAAEAVLIPRARLRLSRVVLE